MGRIIAFVNVYSRTLTFEWTDCDNRSLHYDPSLSSKIGTSIFSSKALMKSEINIEANLSIYRILNESLGMNVQIYELFTHYR